MTTQTSILLPGHNQKQKNTARADGSLLHGLAASARIKRKGKSSELLNGLKVFQHSSARALLVLAVVFFSAVLPLDAEAFTGTVRRIVIQAATTAELDDTVLEPGLLVYRVDDPKDVRIGDGMAAGGIRLWNFAALTNPPPVYDRDLDMDGHGIVLNSHYTVQAEGGYLSVYHVGTNPVFRLTGSEAAGHLGILAWENSGTNVVLTVQHIEGDDPPVLEAAETLIDPIWTAVDYELVRLSPVLVSLTFPQPELGSFAYYRVATSVTEMSASFFVPVYVNGAAVLTAETDSAAMEALEDYLTADAAALLYQPAGSYATGTPVYAEAVYNGVTERITLGDPALGSGPEYGEILFGYRENDTMASLRFVDGDMYFSPTGQTIEAWSLVEGVNVWKGKMNDTESARIRTDLSPMSASGTVTYAANTTNRFIRPDGLTNSVAFDADGTMRLYFPNTTNVVLIRTNGVIRAHGFGVGRDPGAVYLVDVAGDARFTSIVGTSFKSSADNNFAMNPYATSKFKGLVLTETLVVTQGVSQIILPTATNGLVPGTLWNNGGTVSVMP